MTRCLKDYMAEILRKGREGVKGDASFRWYGAVLKLINGLRQAVDHPLNLFSVLSMVPPHSIQKLQDELAKIRHHASVYEQIYNQIDAYCKHKAPKNPVPEISSQPYIQREESYFEMDSQLEYILGSQDNKGCILCFHDAPDDLVTLRVRCTPLPGFITHD